jgi:hypothetical protein
MSVCDSTRRAEEMPLDATAKYAVLIEGKLYPWNTVTIVHQPPGLQEGQGIHQEGEFQAGMN